MRAAPAPPFRPPRPGPRPRARHTLASYQALHPPSQARQRQGQERDHHPSQAAAGRCRRIRRGEKAAVGSHAGGPPGQGRRGGRGIDRSCRAGLGRRTLLSRALCDRIGPRSNRGLRLAITEQPAGVRGGSAVETIAMGSDGGRRGSWPSRSRRSGFGSALGGRCRRFPRHGGAAGGGTSGGGRPSEAVGRIGDSRRAWAGGGAGSGAGARCRRGPRVQGGAGAGTGRHGGTERSDRPRRGRRRGRAG